MTICNDTSVVKQLQAWTMLFEQQSLKQICLVFVSLHNIGTKHLTWKNLYCLTVSHVLHHATDTKGLLQFNEPKIVHILAYPEPSVPTVESSYIYWKPLDGWNRQKAKNKEKEEEEVHKCLVIQVSSI